MIKLLVTTHHGMTEEWNSRTEREWIELAIDEQRQWLIDREIDLDTVTIDQAIEALTHDYQSVIEVKTLR